MADAGGPKQGPSSSYFSSSSSSSSSSSLDLLFEEERNMMMKIMNKIVGGESLFIQTKKKDRTKRKEANHKNAIGQETASSSAQI